MLYPLEMSLWQISVASFIIPMLLANVTAVFGSVFSLHIVIDISKIFYASALIAWIVVPVILRVTVG